MHDIAVVVGIAVVQRIPVMLDKEDLICMVNLIIETNLLFHT